MNLLLEIRTKVENIDKITFNVCQKEKTLDYIALYYISNYLENFPDKT